MIFGFVFDHCQLKREADLRCSEAHSRRGIHCFAHGFDQLFGFAAANLILAERVGALAQNLLARLYDSQSHIVYFGVMPHDVAPPAGTEPVLSPEELEPEPRWPAVLTMLTVGGLYGWLPERLTPGPSWLLLAIVGTLLVPTVIANRVWEEEDQPSHRIFDQRCDYAGGGMVAGDFASADYPRNKKLRASCCAPLLRCGCAIFWSLPTWYWRLDAGGPHARDSRKFHTDGAFLFPQMTLPKGFKETKQGWRPGFVDYLFLAFNTSTAFSPTDVPVLSRWAKLLMMVQSSISLGTLAILAARAINIL